jgi:hypothetical protein
MKAFLFSVFLISTIGSSYAQDVHISLVNCTIAPKELSEIKSALSFQLQFYARVFNDTVANKFKAKIFGSQTEFAKYALEKVGFNPIKESAGAIYNPKLKEMIMPKTSGDFVATFSHELSHAIIDCYVDDPTTWLNEGIAEFLEDIIFQDTTFYFRKKQLDKVKWAREYLKDNASVLELVNADDFYNGDYKNYSLAWGIIYYLYNIDQKILSRLLKEDRRRADNLLEDYYPGGANALEQDVKSFFLNFDPNRP